MDKHKILKEQFKQWKAEAGVYQVRNLENGKIFVASSSNLAGMFNRLRFELETKMHKLSPELQQDWNQAGPDHFAFEILDVLKLKEGRTPEDFHKELALLETLWLEKLQPYAPQGYNPK